MANYKKFFNICAGSLLFIFGLAVEIKNFFLINPPNGYEIVFGIEFITVGVWLVYGKFNGFNNNAENKQ